tara:strand:- start:53 stop:526 length:474 start_codon:yes stop_codon:yes gene_type:complete
MKKLILISALLFSFNGWAEIISLSCDAKVATYVKPFRPGKYGDEWNEGERFDIEIDTNQHLRFLNSSIFMEAIAVPFKQKTSSHYIGEGFHNDWTSYPGEFVAKKRDIKTTITINRATGGIIGERVVIDSYKGKTVTINSTRKEFLKGNCEPNKPKF